MSPTNTQFQRKSYYSNKKNSNDGKDKRPSSVIKMNNLLVNSEVQSILRSSGFTINTSKKINGKVLETIFEEIISAKCSMEFAICNFDVISLIRIARIRDESFLDKFLSKAFPDTEAYSWKSTVNAEEFLTPLVTRKDLSENFIKKFLYLISDDFKVLDKALTRVDISETLKNAILTHIGEKEFEVDEFEEDDCSEDEIIESDSEETFVNFEDLQGRTKQEKKETQKQEKEELVDSQTFLNEAFTLEPKELKDLLDIDERKEVKQYRTFSDFC